MLCEVRKLGCFVTYLSIRYVLQIPFYTMKRGAEIHLTEFFFKKNGKNLSCEW